MGSFSRKVIVAGIVAAFCLTVIATPVSAGVHTWRSWQVFTNADGTVQFVAIKEAFGGANETGTAGFDILSLPSGTGTTCPPASPHCFSMPTVVAPTNDRYFLVGTTAFQALPGAPPVDGTIPSNFVVVATDNALRSYTGGTNATWTAGTLPTNGIDMFHRTNPDGTGALSATWNVATNYAGVTGCVDASGAAPVVLPGVPDGTTGSPLIVGKSGSDLTLTFDTTLCTDTFDHQVLYGHRKGFPARAGGLYTVAGGVCSGVASPYNWAGVPTDPNPPVGEEGNRLTWFLVVTHDGAGTQGPWGKWNNSAFERNGTGPRCASSACAMTSKSAYGSTCGH